MGMFDTIWFKCPICETAIEHQSKAGECLLHDYSEKAVPIGIAVIIENDDVYCEKCKNSFSIRMEAPPPESISMALIQHKKTQL